MAIATQSREFDVTLGGTRLRVRTIGDVGDDSAARPTIVFLHDSLGCISVWRDFPDRLASALSCGALVYDRRGYGASTPFGPEPRRPAYLEDEAGVLAEVLEKSGIKNSVLFGHSDGGSIALVAAARRPDLVSAVITEGAHVFVEELTLAGIRTAQATLRDTDLRDRLARHHGHRTDAVTSAWIDVWLSAAFRDWNIERYLPAIRCPVLALQGTDDEYGTPDQVRAIVAGVSGLARAGLIPGVGHTPHRETPEEVIRLTTDFLTSADVAKTMRSPLMRPG